jgi:hypothetical protein
LDLTRSSFSVIAVAVEKPLEDLGQVGVMVCDKRDGLHPTPPSEEPINGRDTLQRPFDQREVPCWSSPRYVANDDEFSPTLLSPTPICASTMRWVTARPKPIPPGLPLQKGSNTFVHSSRDNPGRCLQPLSLSLPTAVGYREKRQRVGSGIRQAETAVG